MLQRYLLRLPGSDGFQSVLKPILSNNACRAFGAKENSGIGDGAEDFLKVGFLKSGCLMREEGLDVAGDVWICFVFMKFWMREGTSDVDGRGRMGINSS